MSNIQENHRQKLYRDLMELAEKKIPKDQLGLLENFIQHYYSSVALEDLIHRNIIDLFGAVLSHWKIIYQRTPGQTALRIYNPSFEQEGWQSSHTIIEVALDDMPFLVDSIQNELNRRNITTHIIFHSGSVYVTRDAENKITEVFPMGSGSKSAFVEAPIFIEIDRQTDPAVLADLEKSLLHILKDVKYAVEDFQKMREKVQQIIDGLEINPPPIAKEELDESVAFLKWLLGDDNKNFIFLGCRDYQLDKENGDLALRVVDKSGLGVLRESKPGKISKHFSEMPPEARAVALSKNILIISKSSYESSVHRAAKNDIIGIKIFDEQGQVVGEHRILGLYTSSAYHSRPHTIPFLRKKISEVMEKSKLSPKGHAGKALINILETLPRDDLFQASTEELLDLCLGILHLQERRIIRLFVRKDIYGRFMSCLVYVPKDKYNTDLTQQMENILVKAFNSSEVTCEVFIGESVLARLHFMVKIDPLNPPIVDVAEIEQDLIQVGKQWDDELRKELIDYYGEERGVEIAAYYYKGFSSGYRENFSVRNAVYDIDHIQSLQTETDLAMSFFKPIVDADDRLRLKLFQLEHSVPLSDALPILENMGLRVLSEQPYRIVRKDGTCAWMNDFTLETIGKITFDIDEVREKFEKAFSQVWYDKVDKDRFNRLVLTAQLNWKQIFMLRAYARYLKQIGFTFSQNYIAKTLNNNPELTIALVHLFEARFDPAKETGRESRITAFQDEMTEGLEKVSSLDEDKIIRRMSDLILATLRTNYYQKDAHGQDKSYLSFKLASHLIPEMPLPMPKFEIFVYSPVVEGIHLRTSSVARGGLRWSDRPEDFRTEILGLMKAQNVKNAVIVPSGAKGGFIPKRLPINGDREAIMQEAIASYKVFISGLLDITDNLVNQALVPPTSVIRYDADDPYLVVAADKGTASFSNYANEVAESYGFWLGDAFASGGSTGYDHKKMGITARGAWESVKRHFREMGVNTQTEPFTVIGIGDMAGDVFGNGMLLSQQIRLVAAFNHAHIFVDPNPDAALSFQERERLFYLPRSTWDDYDRKVISAGGGVFSRAAKYIDITPQMKERFAITKDRLEPNQFIDYIMRAEVDLLWNGGIGTFVKGTQETNEQVGDKANDAIRINGYDLRVKVVVEGGNLGFTQLGRVEFALNGGKILTDFIDNSAGVDCSDHEVNLKILLNTIVANGDMTVKQRNQLLADMTEDVGHLVLKNNYWQTQAVSIALKQVDKNHDLYVRFIHLLESVNRLNRAIEFIPDDKSLQERKGSGRSLTAPELCVLLAYSKILLKDEILVSTVPEDPYLSRIISTAFPSIIRKDYHDHMLQHSLRREIIATQLSNVIINKMGITYVSRVQEETGANIPAIVSAYAISHEIFNIGQVWESIEALDNQVSAEIQIEMMLSVSRLVRRSTRWLLRNHRDLSHIESVIALYKDGIMQLEESIHLLVGGTAKEYVEEKTQYYLNANVPEPLARRVAANEIKFALLDIISATQEHHLNLQRYAKVYFGLGFNLELGWLRGSIISQPEENHWDALAKAALRDDIDWQQKSLTVNALLLYADKENTDEVVSEWLNLHQDLVARWKKMLIELRSSNIIEFVKYAVAVRELLDLTQASSQYVKQMVSV
jgi:glutamate dehydrogenase